MTDQEREEKKANDIKLYCDQIDQAINDYCTENNIDDLKSESQNVFTACCMYVGWKVFKGTDKLFQKENIYEHKINEPHINKNKNIAGDHKFYDGLIQTTYHAYNYDYIYDLIIYYIYLCNKYDKIVTIPSFCCMVNISINLFYVWNNSMNRLSNKPAELYNVLRQFQEEGLTGRLMSNKNPVGTIAILNKHYGYNMPGVSNRPQQKTLTSSDLPKLDG